VTPNHRHTLPTITANLNPQSTSRLQYECPGQRLFISPNQVKCTGYQYPVFYSHVTPFAAVLSSLVTLEVASRWKKRLDGSQAQKISLGALVKTVYNDLDFEEVPISSKYFLRHLGLDEQYINTFQELIQHIILRNKVYNRRLQCSGNDSGAGGRDDHSVFEDDEEYSECEPENDGFNTSPPHEGSRSDQSDLTGATGGKPQEADDTSCFYYNGNWSQASLNAQANSCGGSVVSQQDDSDYGQAAGIVDGEHNASYPIEPGASLSCAAASESPFAGHSLPPLFTQLDGEESENPHVKSLAGGLAQFDSQESEKNAARARSGKLKKNVAKMMERAARVILASLDNIA
jgi:hypothetical protein